MKRLSRQDVAPRTPPAAVSAPASAPAKDGAPGAAFAAVRGAAALLVLASPVIAAWGAWAWMTRTPGFAVRRVIVTGTLHATSEGVAARSGALGRNAFALDLAQVRASLLGDPWIADAVVRRAPPHELRVAVTEREPAAFVPAGKDAPARVVDADGRVLAEGAAAEALQAALPIVAGLESVPEPQRAARLALGAATLQALKASAPRLWERARALDVSEAGKLVLAASGCPPIWLSGPASADEAAAWSRREDSIVQAIGRAAWVDARWRDRLHVMPLASAKGA